MGSDAQKRKVEGEEGFRVEKGRGIELRRGLARRREGGGFKAKVQD